MHKLLAIHHVSLLISDVTRARAFYEGILGLTPDASRPVMAFDGVWYTLGATQIHLLCLPDPCNGMRLPEHGGRDRHLALQVDNVAGLAERLQQHGITFTLSRSGRKALFCRDPDRNTLEFLQVQVV